ncbi:MAG: acyl-CoA thioesterase [Burkholderiales bacterium]
MRLRHGIIFVVRHVAVDFFRPAVFNDELEITVEAVEKGRGTIGFAHSVCRGEDLLTGARVKLARINANSFKPVKMPDVMITTLGKES